MTGINRPEALDKAFEFIYKSETDGLYLEFGVFQGISLARALRSNTAWQKKTGRKHVARFIGFDSFQGLPQFEAGDMLSNYGVFEEGQFADTSPATVYATLEREQVTSEGVALVPGFFSESLPAEHTQSIVGNGPVSIIHIDCDLYSSARDCLDFLSGKIADGAVMLFDDWYCYRGRPDSGVHKAFNEWLESAPYLASDYFSYGWAGRAFIINTKL